MRTLLFGGLLATALMSVGCGGTLEQEDALDLESQKAPLPDCSSGVNDLRNSYSDAAHTSLVGQWGCWCGGLYNWGTGSQYVEYILEC
ncbi:hypothetical protein [Pyxidicoccus caerfyrddinensis]|jgi:hypothetical protein|uniref:hypothetical protein n=1 Tax=Pyxidicoccus caerfyrddinensis TaxID=2709663 RepID=UPI0013DAFD1C|nr:hypothetical protein [Pyxidicoccus caerfyrddinensis]